MKFNKVSRKECPSLQLPNEVLYTHQKLKKAKTWKDGCLKVSATGTKAVLFDDVGCSLEVFHILPQKIISGNDIECERYLINVGDEKIPEGTRQNDATASPASNDGSTNFSRCGVNNGPTSTSGSNLETTLGKRKRAVSEAFRPHLPCPGKAFSNYNGRCASLESNQLTSSSTCGANDFHFQRSFQKTALNSRERREMGKNNFDYDKSCRVTTFNSKTQNELGRNFSAKRIGSKVDQLSANMSTAGAPVTKRTKSEILALFGEKRRVTLNKENHGLSSNPSKLNTPLKPNFVTVSSDSRISSQKNAVLVNNKSPKKMFNMSVEYDEDFFDTSFLSQYDLNKNRGRTNDAATTMLSHFKGQALKSGMTQVHEVSVLNNNQLGNDLAFASAKRENFTAENSTMKNTLLWDSAETTGDNNCLIDQETGKALDEYCNGFKANCFMAETSSLNELWKSKKIPETRGSNVFLNEESCYGNDFKGVDGDFQTNGTPSFEPTRSLTGPDMGVNSDRRLSRDNFDFISRNSSWRSDDFQSYCNVSVNNPVDSEFDGFLFENGGLNCYDNHDDDVVNVLNESTTSPLSGCVTNTPRSMTGGHGATCLTTQQNASSPANSITSVSGHSGKDRKNTQFVSPLIAAVNNHHRATESSNIEEVTVCPSDCLSFSGVLYFPSNTDCSSSAKPTREVTIPTKFTSPIEYKGVLKSALREHLNIVLFELARQYHGILNKVDISTSLSDVISSDEKESIKGPSCLLHGPARLRAVKKDGPNKGRPFYVCPASGPNQCKFFQWADEGCTNSTSGRKKISLSTSDSIRNFFKGNGVYFYHNCLLERRSQPTKFFGKKYSNKSSNVDYGKKAMYVVLKYRDSSSLYTKGDIWIVSKSIDFEPSATFVAKSAFFGPSSNGDLEIEPVSGYSPSNWRSGDTVHAIWACNAGTELSCIQNLDEHVTLQHLPLLTYLLNGSHLSYGSRRSHLHSFFVPPSRAINDRNSLGLSWQIIEQETVKAINLYKLNTDQAVALRSCAQMFISDTEENMAETTPITLVHGVFGAGKSFLLAVVVLLMVKLFEMSDASREAGSTCITWKILISSTTNVAVDRILLGLLELGFDKFVRVGSVRKIAKPILPYSIHSIGTESQELKELQGMLKTDLTSVEKAFVRKGIEIHKLGENRKKLANVRVIGVTCAACTFAALERLKFPILLLDECSQMTEPTSLLPMARFGCRKLVLVGDPKQLNPTIQGSDPSHDSGLEQTLFDRLIKMGMTPMVLRTQYRCHPVISSISNRLFYNDRLLNGVTDEERKPLVDFVPTLCFYDVSNGEECSQDGSYFNTAEARFVVILIKSLLESDVEAGQIGVITQYKSQLTAITNSFTEDGATSHKELAGIQISTVDAFQGGEKDIIILSCVRTKHIGFIDCERRTNVALTRAKRHLCIVGCAKMLSSNSLWGKILSTCRESPDGFQSAEFYVKKLAERVRKLETSCHTTKTTCAKLSSPPKSKADKSAFKPAHKPSTKKLNASKKYLQSHTVSSSQSSYKESSALSRAEEIWISDRESSISSGDEDARMHDIENISGIGEKLEVYERNCAPFEERSNHSSGNALTISENTCGNSGSNETPFNEEMSYEDGLDANCAASISEPEKALRISDNPADISCVHRGNRPDAAIKDVQDKGKSIDGKRTGIFEDKYSDFMFCDNPTIDNVLDNLDF